MKCPVCDKLLIDQGTLCCPECKETLIGMMQNLERMCESDNEQNVFLAYSLMKDWSLFQHVESLYGNKQSYSINFPTIQQQNNFISQAYEEYNEKPEDWIKDLEFYKKEAKYLVKFIQEHI